MADSPVRDATSYPFVGITLSHYTASNPPQNINVVDVDLGSPGIHFFVTPQIPEILPYTVRRQYTLDFLQNQGAQIAIDAHRYWPTPPSTGGDGVAVNLEGVVASAGSVYESFFDAYRAPPPLPTSWPALNISAGNQVAVLYGDASDPLGETPLPEGDDIFGHQSVVPPMALYNTVSGDYQIVSNGIPITSDRLFLANDFNPNPRTGIGFTASDHLMLVAVDGGGNPWYGMKVAELGWFMATNLGVFDAINADGGGSTTLAIATPTPHLVNYPSSGTSGRAVGSGLAVFAVPAYVALAGIADGATFTSPTEIDISAQVIDTAGVVTNVAFYAGTALLQNIASPPGPAFTLQWSNPAPGNYALSAVAMDNSGLSTTSTVISITVASSSDQLNTASDTPLLPAWATKALVFLFALVGLIGISLHRQK